MTWYRLLLIVSLIFSPGVSASIESEIAAAQSALSSARSEEYRLRSLLRQVENEISRVQREIYEANSKMPIVQSEISTLNNQTATYNAEAAEYRREAGAFRAERDRQITRRAELSARLETLLEENYELQKQIDAENIKIAALEALYVDLDKVNSMVSDVSTVFNDTVARNQRALTRHESWLNAFHSVVQNYKPIFSNITSADTYKVEHNKIVNFTDSIPSQASAKGEEASTHILIQSLINKIKATYDFSRTLPDKQGMGYLSLQNQQGIRDELIEVDKRLTSLQIESSGIQSSIYRREYKRLYMIDFTILAWTRLIEESLLAANIQDASAIINSVAFSLNDTAAYSRVRSLLTNKENDYKKDYRTYYAPMHARRGAVSTLQTINNISDNLATMQISDSTRVELQAFITDHIGAVNRDLENINEDLLNRDYHHQRRISFAENMLSRYQDRMTSVCIETANALINDSNPSISHEKSFINFKGSCLR